MTLRNTTRLKTILARRNATLAPGAANALFDANASLQAALKASQAVLAALNAVMLDDSSSAKGIRR
jgi:hypothetical protein